MILGALHGTGALPKRWLKKLDPATRAACETQATQLVAFAPALSGRSRAVTAE
jgi:ADP-ribosyl-[dinitrogen reductase] hydrolase